MKLIKLASIDAPEIDIRIDSGDSDMTELCDSIARLGLIEPIAVVARGKRYEIIAGHRRYKACKSLGWVDIPCVVHAADDAKVLEMRIAENLQRSNLTIVEEAYIANYLINTANMSMADAAKAMGKSVQHLIGRIDVLSYPDFVQTALAERRVTLSVIQELMHIEDDNLRPALLENAISGGISKRTAMEWRRSYSDVMIPAISQEMVDLNSESHQTAIHQGMRCFTCGENTTPTMSHAPLICGDCFATIIKSRKQNGIN